MIPTALGVLANLHEKYNRGKEMEIQPKDPSKGHFYVSLVKSGLRMIAGSSIVAAGYVIPGAGWLIAGGVLLIGAEILGVVEELV